MALTIKKFKQNIENKKVTGNAGSLDTDHTQLTIDEFKKLNDEGKLYWRNPDGIQKGADEVRSYIGSVSDQSQFKGNQWTDDEYNNNRAQAAGMRNRLRALEVYANSIKDKDEGAYRNAMSAHAQLSGALDQVDDWFRSNEGDAFKNNWENYRQADKAQKLNKGIDQMRAGSTAKEQAAALGLDEKELETAYKEQRDYEKQEDLVNRFGGMSYDELLGVINDPKRNAQRIVGEVDQYYKNLHNWENESEQDMELALKTAAERNNLSVEQVREIYNGGKEMHNRATYASDALSNDDTNYIFSRIIESGSAEQLQQLKKDLPSGKYYDKLRNSINLAIEEKKEQRYFLDVKEKFPEIDKLIETKENGDEFYRQGFNEEQDPEGFKEYDKANKLLSVYEKMGVDVDKYKRYKENHKDRLINNMFQTAVSYAADKHPVLTSLASTPVNMIGSLGDVPKVIRAAFDDDYYYDPKGTANYTASNIRSTVSNKIDNPGWEFLYNTGMSMSDSAVGIAASYIPVVGQFVSSAMFFSSAGVSAANEVIENGGTPAQAAWTMLAQGAAELVFENVSLEKLKALQAAKNGKGGIKQLITNTLKQSFTESSEEVFTSLANTLTDQIINGDLSAYSRNRQKYIDQGMSEEEANGAAVTDWLKGIGMDAAGGAVSGGIFGAGGSTKAHLSYKSAMKNTTVTLGGVEMSAKDALKAAPDHFRDLAQKLTESKNFDVTKLTEIAKNASEDGKARTLADSIERTVKESGKEKITSADVENLLNALYEENIDAYTTGEHAQSAEAWALADLITDSAQENDLGDNDKAILDKVKNGTVLSEDERQAVENSPKLARKIAGVIIADPEKIKTVDFDEKRSNQEKFKASDNGKTLVNDKEFTGGIEIASVNPRTGTITYDLNYADGSTEQLTSDKIRFATPVEAQLNERAASYNTDQARAFVENYHEGQDVDNYAREWNLYSNYGRLAINLDVEKMNVGGTLTNAQKIEAYQQGLNSRIAHNQAQTIAKSVEELKPYTSQIQGTFTYNVPSSVKLTKAQSQMKGFFRDMAAVTGLNIEIFQSQTDAGGNYIGENGSYDPSTNTLRVDINAGLNHEGQKEAYQYSMLNTVAHELTHVAKQGGKYENLREAVIAALGTTETKFNELVDKKYDQLKKNERYKNLSDEKLMELADEEVICDACETMLQGNSKFFENLYKKDRGLAKKFVEAIKNLVEKIKSFVADRHANTEYGRALLEVANDLYNQIQQLWNEAVAEGLEVTNALSERDKKTARNANKALFGDQNVPVSTDQMYSLREYDKIQAKQITRNKNVKAIDPDVLAEAHRVTTAMAEVMINYVDENGHGIDGILPDDVKGKTIHGNASYGKTMENALVCVRTLTYEHFKDMVAEKVGRPLTVSESLLASQMIYDIAVDPQCLYCYVAADRKAYDEYIGKYWKEMDAFIQGVRRGENVDALWENYLNGRKETDVQKKRKAMWLKIAKSGESYISESDIATRKLRRDNKNRSKGIIADAERYAQSASWAKKYSDYVAYSGQILSMRPNAVNKLNQEYGLRMYSFSDYTPAFIVENMQMITDASLKGLKMLSYTKDADFAKIFGATGMGINISCFAKYNKMLDTYVEDNRQGANWEETQRLRDQFENVGSVMVVTNDDMLKWALNQDWIDVVIPYHIVKTGSKIAGKYGWENYTAQTSDKFEKGTVKADKKEIMPPEHDNDFNKFKTLVEERNITPRFNEWYKKVGKEITAEQYMKLVNEVRTPASKLNPVQPVFDLKAAMDSFGVQSDESGEAIYNSDGSPKVIEGGFVDKGGYEGGWYKKGVDVDENANRVAEDILSGKNVEDVEYGRQNIRKKYSDRFTEIGLEAANARKQDSSEKSNPFSKNEAEQIELSDTTTRYSIRTEAPPENTVKGYKVFRVKDGKLYPPMVANPGGEATPVGVWLNADVGERAPDSKTGRAQVKGKGGMSLSFRPGWHLGDIPRAAQFDRKNPETGIKELFPADFVWAECDCAADVDYQDEAMSYGYTENGKFRHSYAGLPRVPENGYYKYRTNPRPDTVPWIITGAIKVNRILSDSEVAQILKDNGVEPPQRQGGNKTIEELGLSNDHIRYQDRDYSVEPEEYGDLFDDLFTDDGDLSFGEEADTRRAESIIDKMIEYDAENAAYFLSYSAGEIAQNTLNGLKDIELSDSSYLKIAKRFYKESTIRMNINSEEIAEQVKLFVGLYDDGMFDSFDSFLSQIVRWNEQNVRSDRFASPENMLANAYNLISLIAEEKASYANNVGEMSEKYAKMERASTKAKAEVKQLKAENQELNRSLSGQEDLTDYYRKETYDNRKEIANLRMLNKQLEKARTKAEEQAERRIERTVERYNKKLDKQKLKASEQKAAALDRMRERYEKLLTAEKTKAKDQRRADHDKVVERYEKKIAELKEKAEQQKRDIREDRDTKLIAAKDKRQADLKALRDNRDKKEYVRKIKKVASELQQWALHPTDKHFVPQEFLRSGFYQAVNDITEALIISDNTQIADKLRKIAAGVIKLQGEAEFKYDIDPVIAAEMNDLADAIGDKKINRDLTLRQAEDIYRALRTIKDSVVNARKLIFEGETKDVVEAGVEIINEQKQINPALFNRSLNNVKKFFLTPERVHNIINGYNEGSTLDRVFQGVKQGIRKKNNFYMDANKMFDAYRDAHVKELDQTQHKVRDIKWTDNAGHKRTTKMTGMQAMQLVMTWNREAADSRLAHMKKGGVSILGAEALAKGNLKKAYENRETVLGINESFITNVQNSLTEFERGYIDIAEQFFNGMAKDAINEVSMILRHFETATSEYYIPIKVDDAEIVKEIEGVKQDSSIENMGMLKSVVPYSDKSVLIQGLDNVINKHIDNVGNYYGLAIPIRNMNKVLNVSDTVRDSDGSVVSRNSVKKSLEKNWGKLGTDIYEQLLIDLQNSRAPSNERMQGINNLVRKIRSNFVTATLNGNISVTIKQAASYSTAGVYLDQTSLMKGSADMIKFLKPGNLQALFDEIDSHTAQHYIRRKGLSSNEIADVQQSWLKTSKLGRNINNSKLMQKMPAGVNPTNWIQEMDCMTTAALWCATKEQINKQYKKAGKQIDTDEYWQDVTDLYDKVIEDTQPMYDAMHRPEILKSSSELIKSVFMFKTQPLQNAGIIYDAVGRVVQNKKDKAAWKQLRKGIMSQGKSLLVFAGMSLFSAFVLHRMDRYRDEDDEVTAQSIWDTFIKDVIQNGAGVVLPFGGNEGAGAIINTIDTGKLDFSSVMKDNVAETVTGFFGAGADLVNTINEQLGSDDPDTNKIATAAEKFTITWVSDIFGVPVKNAKNIIKGGVDWAEDIADGGEKFKPDVSNMKAKQIIHSYQKHFENGETDIANSRIQDFYDLKLQSAKDKGKDDPEKEARNAVRDAFTDYYKKIYQKAFRENNTAELERIRKVLVSQSKYMVWGAKNTPLSEKLREWQKEASKEK